LGARLQLVKGGSIAVSDLAPVALTNRCRIDESSAFGVIFVRIVSREEDAIGAPPKGLNFCKNSCVSAWFYLFDLKIPAPPGKRREADMGAAPS
jgi:hypothetical protein